MVIVGRSMLVGKPLANLFIRKELNSTVTVLPQGYRESGGTIPGGRTILVACAGRPGIINGDMVKPGACVSTSASTGLEDPDAARGYRLVGMWTSRPYPRGGVR